MVGAATEKPLEPKQVRTRGTHSKLVSDERNVHIRHVYFIVFSRATGRSAKRVLAVVIMSVCPSVRPSQPCTEPSPGEIETPGFQHMIA